ncbi:MAG TPA: hypothetical protein P5555_05610 [Candidatus Paceibacterota bacterium]|nr:hypothetical protein [Verrucomicrobiota bacterium]HOX02752.1 hypothetical protein [Verrucomicrobiota bacterium]HRZ44647.1 hypothetical protein [Candidatus Paceibacterota bacterium]HRZ92176.1 hypothetical protein [Candidatus Paceibacterota bacterium]
MFDKYSGDEAFALIVGILVGIGSWMSWYYALRVVGRAVRPRGWRQPLALVPLVCALLLYVVLARWSAEDVRTDPAYMIFYMVIGMAWLGLFRLPLPLAGLSVRDDVLERGNDAAAWAVSGALIGGTCCFAGANVGNGPGWWVVLFSGLLSTATLMLLWWMAHLGSRLIEKVTVDRDCAAGVRAAGFLVGAGLMLGRAAAGDWVSAAATLADFGRMAWPAAALAGVGVIIERSCAPEFRNGSLALATSGGLPALVYVGAGIVVMWAW